ncbi:inversin-like [Haliotis rubra]|uniref:inversin-like n=1 Tax=Haliotis rubra TaxID=36100 RepID=UPI001EE5487B|nr:inversin-like [Haliotis rubra]
MTGNMKEKAIIFRNIDMKTCQLDCNDDSFIFAHCHRTSESKKIERTGGRDGRSENQSHNIIDINSPHLSRKTPVTVASVRGYKGVVELPSKGADMSLINKKGNKRRNKKLLGACRSGDVEAVKQVLEQVNVDINSRGFRRMTPMLLAAKNGHRGVLDFLVSEGADMSLVDQRGHNVLHAACRAGYVEIVKYVLSQNILDINRGDKMMRTPLMVASETGHKDVVELLVRSGANVSLVNEKGRNFLHFACQGGDVETVKYVLAQDNVGINSRDFRGRTPVMEAAKNGHKEVVVFLLSKGADVSLVDVSGNHLLHTACEGGNIEVVKYVLAQDSVDINARNKKGKTAADTAKSHGLLHILDLL